MRLQPPTPSRRALLGLGAGVPLAAVAGCDLDGLRAPETTPAAPPTTAAPDADEQLVESATTRIRAARATAAAAATTPGVSAEVSTAATTLVTLHDTHLEALTPGDGSAAPSGDPSASPSTPDSGEADDEAVSLRQLRRSETALQADLAADSVSAANAELAQLLGSMSAAVAQQVSLLPTGAGR